MQITEQQYWSLPEDLRKHFMTDCMPEVTPGYEKVFYCPKVSRKERHVGYNLTNIPTDSSGMYGTEGVIDYLNKKDAGRICAEHTFDRMAHGPDTEYKQIGNNHPTVKPVALMTYLIKLVTPPSTKDYQCKVLDPFNGSGSTGMAATALGHHYTGCDLDEKYLKISQTRIDAWNTKDIEEPTNNYEELFESEE